MQLNSDFLLLEHKVELEQIVHGHHWNGVYITVTSQESSEVFVLTFHFIPVVEFHNVEVLFSLVELVLIITQECTVTLTIAIPLIAEMVLQENEACFERLVID